MTDLINKTSEILTQGSELMKNPEISGTVSGLFKWLKNILGKKSAKEKLELIEQNRHNEETIAGLKANLEFILEDNEELQKQLSQKIDELDKITKAQSNITIKTTSSKLKGNSNKTYQDINNSNITDSSINQNHSGNGDNIAGNKTINH